MFEGPPATTFEPEPKAKRTEFTITQEVEPLSESDKGCEPMTSEAEGTGTEDWLLDAIEEGSTPTLAHTISNASSLFKDSTESDNSSVGPSLLFMNDMDCDLLFFFLCVDCILLAFIMYSLVSPPLSQSSASPPASPLLEACSPAPSLEMPGTSSRSSSNHQQRFHRAIEQPFCGSASSLGSLCSILAY